MAKAMHDNTIQQSSSQAVTMKVETIMGKMCLSSSVCAEATHLFTSAVQAEDINTTRLRNGDLWMRANSRYFASTYV